MVDWSGPQTSRNRSHGTVKHSVKRLGVGATAPDWREGESDSFTFGAPSIAGI